MILLVLVVLFLAGCGNSGVACAVQDCPKPHNPATNTITAEQMSQLAILSAQIRTWAPTCQGGIACLNGDDGDSMLWAGLLCATGERAQCDAVRASQTTDGRLWRAPSRVNVQTQNASSRDMLLGFLHYLVGSHDTDGATRLYNYLKKNDYELCPNASNNRCDFGPIPYVAGWGTLGQVFKYLGLPETSEMRDAQIFGVDQLIINLSSDFAAEGFPLHLLAAEVRLRQLTNNFTSALQQTANTVLQRQPNNPFYEYVAKGKTTRAAQLVLAKCPSTKPAHADQWAWQRDETAQAWLESCGWDCLYVINLLTE